MRLYSKEGVELSDNDIYFLREGDVVYLDMLGQNFNFAQVLDQYVKVAQLGLTGKVFKLRDISSCKQSVIKMIPFKKHEDTYAEIDEFIRNLGPLKTLEHRNVVRWVFESVLNDEF